MKGGGIRDHPPIKNGAPDKSVDVGVEHGNAVVPRFAHVAPLNSTVE